MTHSPIPEELGCILYDGSLGKHRWGPLPPDLDRLFRASPKFRDALDVIAYATDPAFNLADARRLARAALALAKSEIPPGPA